jgi:hypothetical protein
MNTPQNLLAHLRNAETNHIGFSYNINNGDSNPETGYMVSRVGHEEIVPQGADLVAYGKHYFLRHAEQLAEDNAYMGCWYNGSQFVFDVSENVQTKEVAIVLGEHNKQDAIWDCASGSEYRLMREGDVEAYNENEMSGMVEAMYEAIDEFEGMYNHCAGEDKDHYETRIAQLNNVLNLLNSLK